MEFYLIFLILSINPSLRTEKMFSNSLYLCEIDTFYKRIRKVWELDRDWKSIGSHKFETDNGLHSFVITWMSGNILYNNSMRFSFRKIIKFSMCVWMYRLLQTKLCREDHLFISIQQFMWLILYCFNHNWTGAPMK